MQHHRLYDQKISLFMIFSTLSQKTSSKLSKKFQKQMKVAGNGWSMKDFEPELLEIQKFEKNCFHTEEKTLKAYNFERIMKILMLILSISPATSNVF